MISLERACRIAARRVDRIGLPWTGKFVCIRDMGDCWLFGPEWVGDCPTGGGLPQVSKGLGICTGAPGGFAGYLKRKDAPTVEVPPVWRADTQSELV